TSLVLLLDLAPAPSLRGGVKSELERVGPAAEVGLVAEQARISAAARARPAGACLTATAWYLWAIGLKCPPRVLALETGTVEMLDATPLGQGLRATSAARGRSVFAL